MEHIVEEIWDFGVKSHEDVITLHVSQVSHVYFICWLNFESEFGFSLQESPERAKQI